MYNARWRVYRDITYIGSPTGYGGVGEVEDCQLVVTGDEVSEYDYGDAPLPYPTKTTGPPTNHYGDRHPIVPGVYLGQSIDADGDGSNVDAVVLDQLRDYSLVAIDVTELNILEQDIPQ